MIRSFFTIAAILLGGSAFAADPLVFISAFEPGKDGGIHAYKLDLKTGVLKSVHRTGGVWARIPVDVAGRSGVQSYCWTGPMPKSGRSAVWPFPEAES